jgi:hypothetical protein
LAGRVRILLETYMATLASEPEFAKVVHIDALAAGETVRNRWADSPTSPRSSPA